MIVLVLIAVATIYASDVVVLNAANFDSATAGKGTFIKFYAPWCGHCKSLAPTWEKAATQLKAKAQFAKVDCTANEVLCGEFEIQGYPTLLFQTADGKLTEFNGGRDIKDFEKFIDNPSSGSAAKRTKSTGGAAAAETAKDSEDEEANGPSEVVALTGPTFKSLKGKKAMLEFYAPWCGFCKKLAPIYDELSVTLKEKGIVTAKIDCTDKENNAALCAEYKVRGYPTLYFLDENNNAYEYGSGERDLAGLLEFANNPTTGTVLERPFVLNTGLAFIDNNWPMFRDDMIVLYNYKKAALAATFVAGMSLGAIIVAMLVPSAPKATISADKKKN